MQQKTAAGHIIALCTILVWGTTFISSKILLRDFSPVEILFIRFVIGFVALFFFYPHRFRPRERKHELYFMGAGLCGTTLYYLLENIALTYSFASNIGVIVSIAPFFTAIFAHFFLYGERLRPQFFIGFVAAISGIVLISFNGSTVLKLNPLGDLLAVLAAAIWGVYSILVRKIADFGYNTVQTTQRMFFYGIVFMIPALFLMDFSPDWPLFLKPVNLFNILFLGIIASAACFVSWNLATKYIGAVKTSVYIYFTPVVTIITSALVLKEKITAVALIGTVLTLFGLVLSEIPLPFRKADKQEKQP